MNLTALLLAIVWPLWVLLITIVVIIEGYEIERSKAKILSHAYVVGMDM